MSRLWSDVSASVLSLCVLLAAFSRDAAAQQPDARRTLRCESNGTYKRCPATGSWRGARLVHQLSQTACIEGRNWGFDRDAVWVNDGCRGMFEAGDPFANVGERVTCASAGNDIVECPADTRFGARLVRQLSAATCVEGRSWGTNQRGVWVSRGCRGEFLIGSQVGGGGPAATQRMICGSPTGQRVTCATDGSIMSARLLRELGGASTCRRDVTWGHDATGIWIKDGCVAEYEVTVRQSGGGTTGTLTRNLICGGEVGQEVRCQTEVEAIAVRLVTDLSSGRCREGSTWGHTRTFIWTNGGCRARFEVTYRQ